MELPGHGTRFHEPLIHDCQILVQSLADQLTADFLSAQRLIPDLQYAIFGHSAGAIFGFKVAALTAARLRQLPLHGFLSANGAPLLLKDKDEIERSRLDDAALIVTLRKMGGTPPEILAEPGLMAFVLPILRADFAANERCRKEPARPVAFPLTLFAARNDAEVTVENVWAWSDYTTAGCRRVLLEGDHFSVIASPKNLIDNICDDFPAC
jgi:medium-chain acyl-[acyl-carrier-protein] hydrolase